jgi:hypothetical protein
MHRAGGHSDELDATILRYLESCPNACDTAEGVCQWWIPQQRFVEATNDVMGSLVRLVERGEIETHKSVAGQLLYRAVRPE